MTVRPDGRLCNRRVAVLALALLALAASTAPVAAAQRGGGLTIVPREDVFEPGDPIELVVWNNGTTLREGTPTVDVHRCPTAGLCAVDEERVHRWTGPHARLQPGENLTLSWDRRVDGERVPEGTYEVHLAWNGTAGTPDGAADSRRFTLENGTAGHDPDAPRLELVRPTDGATLTQSNLDYEVRVTASDALEAVQVSVDGRVVEEVARLADTETTVAGTVSLAPGSHVLHAMARDAQDRVNRTRALFAVAPGPTAGPGQVAYEPVARGGLEDVTVDGRVLFETIAPRQEATPLEGIARAGALVVRSTTETTVVHALGADGRLTQHPFGFALEGPDGDARAIVALPDGARARASPGQLEVDLDPGREVIVRPVASTAADQRLAQAILAGHVAAEVHVGQQGDADVLAYASDAVQATGQADRVRVDVTVEGPGGRVVVLAIGEDAPLGRELAIRLDGRTLETADGWDDALDPTDDAGQSEGFVLDGDGSRWTAVTVSSFSTRSIVVETAQAVEAFLTPGAVLGALAIVGAAAWGLFRRPEP